jgi:hypothetical protein
MNLTLALFAFASTFALLPALAPVPKQAEKQPDPPSYLVDFASISNNRVLDSSATIRFTGKFAGKEFDSEYRFPYDGTPSEIRDHFAKALCGIMKVKSVGKTELLILGSLDKDGKVIPITELSVTGTLNGADLPSDGVPTVTKNDWK